ncbi:MAG: helix-turn-helix domain-containing protein, partial [Streptosporangiaceae bacterium]
VTVPELKPALVGADGRRLEVPEPVFEALVQVATAMAHGQGVTVIPQNALLTTQEAAELLGISRPTLVRLLEGGIPYEQRGRHRRVMLADLLAYQGSMRRERREALDRMAQEGQAAGLYEATSGPPARTRLSSLMARFPAFLDTCTLYSAYLCDSLLRLCRGRYLPAAVVSRRP